MGGLNKVMGGGPYGTLIGTAGGVSGTGISGPQGANIQQATGVEDVQGAQGGVNNSLQSQQNLLNALQGQNGLGQQSALANQLQNANGVGTQNQAISGLQGIAGQQQNTAGLYQNIANGQGPNPAQAMLNQATGQNISNQAALMAGQRGAGSNVGLMARQAAQQGSATQQQAVGQGATIQANQQLNALSGLTNAQQAQAATQQAIGGFGTTQAGMQQGLANQIANQQIGGTQTNTQANITNTGQLQNALGGVNNANVSSQGNINAANAGLINTAMVGQQNAIGSAMNAGAAKGVLGGSGGGAGGGAAAAAAAHGGEVKKYAPGGEIVPPIVGPSSSFGQFISSLNAPPTQLSDNGASEMIGKIKPADYYKPDKGEGTSGSGPETKNKQGEMTAGGAADTGDASGAGADYENTDSSSSYAAKGGLAKSGGHVKAKNYSQKAVKSGDSYANDKVPAMLSAGEIVVPRSVIQSSNPVANSAAFVQSVLAKKGRKK